jgi:hypothetical protein
VIKRVIHEVSSGTSYPTLTKTNYFDCVHLKKVKLKARALWSVIEDNGGNQQEEMMALDVLYSAIQPEMVQTIAKKDTAWNMIVTMRVGDDRVKKAMAGPRHV